MSRSGIQSIGSIKKEITGAFSDIYANIKITFSDFIGYDVNPSNPLPANILAKLPTYKRRMLEQFADLYEKLKKIQAEVDDEKTTDLVKLTELKDKLDEINSVVGNCIKFILKNDVPNIEKHQKDLKTQIELLTSPDKRLSEQAKPQVGFQYRAVSDAMISTAEAEKKRRIALDYVEANSRDIPLFLKNQILARIIKPSSMDQEKNALCGPVTFLMQLAELDPLKYAELAVQLVTKRKVIIKNKETGETLELENTYSDEKAAKRSIDMICLSALRREANRLQIYASSKSIPSFAEGMLGYSSPGDFIRWYRAFFGNCDAVNTAQVYVKGGVKAPKFVQQLTGVHDNPAYTDLNHNLAIAIDHIERGYSVSMFMTIGLTHLVIECSELPEITHHYNPKNDKYAPALLSKIELGHFVKVKDLKYEKSDDGKEYIHITMDTWTKEYSARVPYDEFIRGYRGCMMVNPEVRLSASKKHDESQAKPSSLTIKESKEAKEVKEVKETKEAKDKESDQRISMSMTSLFAHIDDDIFQSIPTPSKAPSPKSQDEPRIEPPKSPFKR